VVDLWRHEQISQLVKITSTGLADINVDSDCIKRSQHLPSRVE
jgi:hypothetical protein